MNICDYTDTPFASAKRMHHKDVLEGPSSAGFARRNLVGLMGVMMSGGAAKTYDVSDYVGFGSSDLIMMFDGIRNVGASEPHSSSTTKWYDISSGAHHVDFTRNDGNAVKWDDISLVCEGNTFGYGSYIANNIVTLEVVEGHVNRATSCVCQFNSSRQYCFGSGNFEITFTQASNNASIYTGVVNYDYEVCRSVSAQYGANNEMASVYMDGNKMNLVSRLSNFGYMGRQRIAAINSSSSNFNGRIMAIRLYNRALTEDETLHNYAVDKERFGLV